MTEERETTAPAAGSTDEALRGETVSVASNMGFLVVYDPSLLKERVKDPRSWFEPDPTRTEERTLGRLAAWPIGGKANREYRVRLGSDLTEVEVTYDRGQTDPAPLVVEGEELFVGPGERLPGDGFGDRLSQIPGGGGLTSVPPGAYEAVVHVLDWRPDDRFWTEDNEPTEDAPPDFVVVLRRAGELPDAPAAVQPLLDYLPRKKPTASKTVQTGKTWLARHKGREQPEEKPKGRRSRSTSSGGTRTPRRQPVQVAPVTPGTLCVGATVRHPVYGVGKVLFVREGFPKARVNFPGGAEKVDKDDLQVLS